MLAELLLASALVFPFVDHTSVVSVEVKVMNLPHTASAAKGAKGAILAMLPSTVYCSDLWHQRRSHPP